MRSLTKNEKLLVEVAIGAPLKKNEFSVEARIPWELMDRIRSELDAAGIQWRKVRNEYEKIKKERRAKSIENRTVAN